MNKHLHCLERMDIGVDRDGHGGATVAAEVVCLQVLLNVLQDELVVEGSDLHVAQLAQHDPDLLSLISHALISFPSGMMQYPFSIVTG